MCEGDGAGGLQGGKAVTGTFMIHWSQEDQQFVGTHSSYSLSFLADTWAEAFDGICDLVDAVRVDEKFAEDEEQLAFHPEGCNRPL